jgi:hypothetical protein
VWLLMPVHTPCVYFIHKVDCSFSVFVIKAGHIYMLFMVALDMCKILGRKHLVSKVVGCVKREPEHTLTIHVIDCCIV